jgi:hypothetical protein
MFPVSCHMDLPFRGYIGRVMADSGKPGLAEWLRQADSYLSHEDAAALKRSAAESARKRLDAMRREAERLENDLLELGETVISQPPPEALIHEIPQESTSLRALVRKFAAMHPKGATAAEYVAYVASIRSDVDLKNVHSELYRMSKGNGPLKKSGQKPGLKYSLRNQGGAPKT